MPLWNDADALRMAHRVRIQTDDAEVVYHSPRGKAVDYGAVHIAPSLGTRSQSLELETCC